MKRSEVIRRGNFSNEEVKILYTKEERQKVTKSEYKLDTYPSNFFNYIIDIGASGVLHSWHVNFISIFSPKTEVIAYEPDDSYHKEIVEEIEKRGIENLTLYKEFFGDGNNETKDLPQIFKEHNINPKDRWYFKSDCEGAEKYMLHDTETENLLKQCDHMAFEIHHHELPQNKALDWFYSTFSETHKIMNTDQQTNTSTYVLVSKKMMEENPDLEINEYF
jgi:hypothetical protein